MFCVPVFFVRQLFVNRLSPVEHFLFLFVSAADDQISVKVDESGWAWMVCGERLIIWKICQTAVAKVQFSSQKIRK